jgi:hypothetical protein
LHPDRISEAASVKTTNFRIMVYIPSIEFSLFGLCNRIVTELIQHPAREFVSPLLHNLSCHED